MRRLFAVASAALTVGTLAVADAEGDMTACADKKSPDAMAACTRLIDAGQLPPDKLAEVYDQRARVRLSGGDTDSALTDYDAAIRLALADGVIRMRRGDAFRAKGDEVKALADYDVAVRLKPDLWRTHYMRAYMLRRQGRSHRGDRGLYARGRDRAGQSRSSPRNRRHLLQRRQLRQGHRRIQRRHRALASNGALL
jgi:tetratricopeptide (TPR) repeat protein